MPFTLPYNKSHTFSCCLTELLLWSYCILGWVHKSEPCGTQYWSFFYRPNAFLSLNQRVKAPQGIQCIESNQGKPPIASSFPDTPNDSQRKGHCSIYASTIKHNKEKHIQNIKHNKNLKHKSDKLLQVT